MYYSFNLREGDFGNNLINMLSRDVVNLTQTLNVRANEESVAKEIVRVLELVGSKLLDKGVCTKQEVGNVQLGMLYMIRNEMFKKALQAELVQGQKGQIQKKYGPEATRVSRIIAEVFKVLKERPAFNLALNAMMKHYISNFKKSAAAAPGAPAADDLLKYKIAMGRFAAYLAIGIANGSLGENGVFVKPEEFLDTTDYKGRVYQELFKLWNVVGDRGYNGAMQNSVPNLLTYNQPDGDLDKWYRSLNEKIFGIRLQRPYDGANAVKTYFGFLAGLLGLPQEEVLNGAGHLAGITNITNAGQDEFKKFVGQVYEVVIAKDETQLNTLLLRFIELMFTYPFKDFVGAKSSTSEAVVWVNGTDVDFTQDGRIGNTTHIQTGGNIVPYSYLDTLTKVIPYNSTFYNMINSKKKRALLKPNSPYYRKFEAQFQKFYGADRVLREIITDNIEKNEFFTSEEMRSMFIKIIESMISNITKNDRILSGIMPSIDSKYRGFMNESFNIYTDDYKIKSVDYRSKLELLQMLMSMKEAFNYTKYQKDSFKLDDYDNWNTKLFRNEVVNNYKVMREFFDKSVDLFKPTNYGKYIGKVKGLTPEKQYEELRVLKKQYGDAVLKLFNNLILYKYNSDRDFYGIFSNSIKDTKSYKEIEEAYELYIKMVKNKFSIDNLKDIAKYALSIGKGLNGWGYDFNIKKRDVNDSKTIDDALRILNYRLYKVADKYRNKNRMDIVNAIIAGIKRKALCELLSFRSMNKLIQPLMDVINFDLILGRTSPDKEDNLVFEMKEIKNLTLKEFIKKFIETYMDLKRGYTTSKNYVYTKRGFFLDLNDEDLRNGKERIRKLLEEYMNKLEDWREADVKEDKKKNKVKEKEVEEKPEKEEALSKASVESVAKPLMGVHRDSVVSIECEYSKNSNGSGVNIELKNYREEPNCGIVAIPFVNGVDKGPIRLNGGKGTFSNVDISDNTVVHFYYTPVNESGVRIDGNKFIGSVKLHDFNLDGKAKNLTVKYVDKNLDSENSQTVISDYGNKIVIQFPNSLNAKSTLFLTVNNPRTGDNSAENIRHSIVTTKDGKSLLIIDEQQLLNTLGDKFELHLYNSRLEGGTYNTKLEIDRNATEDSKPALAENAENKENKKIKNNGKKSKLAKKGLGKKLKLKKIPKKKLEDDEDVEDNEVEEKEKKDEDEKNKKKYSILNDYNYFSNLDDFGGFYNNSLF